MSQRSNNRIFTFIIYFSLIPVFSVYIQCDKNTPVAPSSGRVTWQVHCYDGVANNPILYNDKVLFEATEGLILCVRTADGERVWGFETEGYAQQYTSLNPCTGSGKAYFIAKSIYSQDANYGLFCLDINTGDLLWVFYTRGEDTDPYIAITTSPEVAGDRLFVGLYTYLVCMDANTGDILWDYNLGNRSFSDATFYNDMVYIVDSYNGLYCFDTRTGNLLWLYSADSPDRYVAISDDGLAIFGSHDLYCVDAENQTLYWQIELESSMDAKPVIFGDFIYVGVNGSINKIDIFTGEVVASYLAEEYEDFTTPYVYGGRVYAGNENGNVYCIDDNSFEMVWTHYIAEPILSSPVVNEDGVFIGGLDHYFYCLNKD